MSKRKLFILSDRTAVIVNPDETVWISRGREYVTLTKAEFDALLEQIDEKKSIAKLAALRDRPNVFSEPEENAEPVVRRIAYLNWGDRIPTYHSFAIEGTVSAPYSGWTGVRVSDGLRDNVLRLLTEIEKEYSIRFELGAGGEIYLPPTWQIKSV